MDTPSPESLADGVRSCHLCPLAIGRKNAVPGEGPGQPRMDLVAEAPAREEDLSGRPFVGRGGKLLASILQSVGVRREEAYITNVVKCRPPRNRLPTRREVVTCRDAHLSRELVLIGPDLVVLLGRTASKAFLGVDTLGRVRGKVIEKAGTKYLCTYHPAAVLRNPGFKGAFSRDLRRASRSSARTGYRAGPTS